MKEICLRWEYADECLLKENEPVKILVRFGLGVRRMHEFLKRVNPEEVEECTIIMLETIKEPCKQSQDWDKYA